MKKKNTETKKSDFVTLGGNVITSIDYKMVIFLFFIGLIIFSDLFINNFLTYFNNAVIDDNTTTKGTIIQLLIYNLCYIVFDLLNKGGFI